MCNRDARMLLSVIKFRATWLSISGDLTKNFGRHNSDFRRHNFGRDDFRATWPEGQKHSLPESHQAFEVTATRISALVILVFSRQTGFLMQASIYWYKIAGHNWARRTRRVALRPGLETLSKQHYAAHDSCSLSRVHQCWSSKRQKGSAGRLKLSFKASRIHFPPFSELSANYCNYSKYNRKHPMSRSQCRRRVALNTGVRQVNHNEALGGRQDSMAFIKIRLVWLFTALAVKTRKKRAT